MGFSNTKQFNIPAMWDSFASFHVNSFNDVMGNKGLLYNKIPKINPETYLLDTQNNIHIRISYLTAKVDPVRASPNYLTPAECRTSLKSYSTSGSIILQIDLLKSDPKTPHTYSTLSSKKITTSLGRIPIMLNSSKCLLNNSSDTQKISLKEDYLDQGGYFIIEGLEVYIRHLLVQRSNNLISQLANSSTRFGGYYNDLKLDFQAETRTTEISQNTFYFLKNNLITIRVQRKRALLFPIVLLLKILSEKTDKQIFDDISILFKTQINFKKSQKEKFSLILNNFNILLKTNFFYYKHLLSIHKDFYNTANNSKFQNWKKPTSREDLFNLFIELYKAFYSNSYKLESDTNCSNAQFVSNVLNSTLFIQTENNSQKYHLLITGFIKLFLINSNYFFHDNRDNLDNLQVLPSGLIYYRAFLQVLYTRRNLTVERIKKYFRTKLSEDNATLKAALSATQNNLSNLVDFKMESLLQMFLSTGSLRSWLPGLPTAQTSGFCQRLERINFITYVNNMRAIHRGSSFVDQKVTKIRKLRPEAFGFLCPVNTPDGEQCGLLSNLSNNCIYSKVSHFNSSEICEEVIKVIKTVNSTDIITPTTTLKDHKIWPILFNGIPIAFVKKECANDLISKLILLKKAPKLKFLEIVNMSSSNIIGRFKCVSIFYQPNVLFRPVYNLTHSFIEYVSPAEQVHLNVYCYSGPAFYKTDKDLLNAGFTHKDVNISGLFSTVASWTPFINSNPSPRNMYQCTMLKQSLSMPTLTYSNLADKKIHIMNNLQTPIVLNTKFGNDQFLLRERPTGANIIIGVISYTGYDMEDAVILNKASIERGLFNAWVITREIVDFSGGRKRSLKYFYNICDGKKRIPNLSLDGFPRIGSRLKFGDPFYSYLDGETGTIQVIHYKKEEECIVDSVVPLIIEGGKFIVKASIKIRINRCPDIGDKFSSRHGQKGTVSLLWPTESMPINEQGIPFDVIINPHAFPSRMTVGMLLEIIAAKGGALEGCVQDASPFLKELKRFENNKVDNYDEFYQKLLVKNGFEDTGEETMISGITGEKLKGKVFMGICYYQRLRQMVKDKNQVRNTDGGRCPLTRQPIKGRKNKGGLRFGEMERDSLIAYGASFLLKERLINVSDPFFVKVCSVCKTYTTVICRRKEVVESCGRENVRKLYGCTKCEDKSDIETVMIPFATNYLINELYAMGIGVKIELGEN